MSCPKFELMIALYVEGDLAPGEAGVVESHLAACDSCRAYAAEMWESQAALKALRNEYVETSAFEQVRANVLAARPRAWRSQAWPRYAIAAGLVTALLAGWLVRRQTDNTVVGVPPVRAVLPTPPAQPLVRLRQPKVLVARARRRSRRQAPRFKSEPLVVKMITDDPQVVIYWLVDQNGG
jgi:anti-sigma factor RsiW